MSSPRSDSDTPHTPSLAFDCNGNGLRPWQIYYSIALLTIVNIFSQMDRMALSALLPFIKKDLSLSDTQIGLLVGLAFSLFHAVCGIPIAKLADRGIRRNLIAASLAAWSVMTAICGTAQNFLQLLAARAGVGVGEAGCVPPSHSMLCDFVRPQIRPVIFSVYATGAYVGITLGMSLAGWLGVTIGWRWTMVALGAPGIVLAIMARFTVREPRRGTFDQSAPAASQLSIGATLGTLLQLRAYRWFVLFMTTNAFVHSSLLHWWPSLYERSYQLRMSEGGAYLGVAIGAGSVIGLLIGGIASTSLRKRDIRLPLMLGGVAIILSAFAKLGSLTIDSVAASIALVFISEVLWCMPNGAAIAALHESVAPNMRASAIACGLLAMYIFGGGLGPLAVGMLSDYLSVTHGNDGLRHALIVIVCISPLVGLNLYIAAEQMYRGTVAGTPQH